MQTKCKNVEPIFTITTETVSIFLSQHLWKIEKMQFCAHGRSGPSRALVVVRERDPDTETTRRSTTQCPA